jgi:hypothetical protein
VSRVLLFVQTGDGRPKCVGRYSEGLTARQCEHRSAADRWWLVECENADAGRKVIAFVESLPADKRHTAECYDWGHILASGGKA